MTNRLASLFLIITLGTTQGANAGALEDGEAAQSRGDYATAVSLYRLAATQGNAWAQINPMPIVEIIGMPDLSLLWL